MSLNFLISFLAGVASILSPCILPLIPVVVGHSLLKRKTGETLAFVGGFFLVFAIITLLTVLFTAAINQYLFYFRITASMFLIGLGVFFILSPSLFKITYIPSYRNDVLGSFITGFITCLAWSPCFGPYIVAIATYSASTGNLFYSAINMLLFTAGFSLTILPLAFMVSKINLERLLKYASPIRIFSGIIIIIAGIYMLLGQMGML
jgi:cytochrome c-type biogenesis protein